MTSPALGAGSSLPTVHRGARCGGGDVPPPITWSSVPRGARSLALWMTDDEGRARWLVYDVAVARAELRQGEGQRGDVDATVGINAAGAAAYGGPCPRGARATVTLVATDLDPRALPEGLTLERLRHGLEGHELGRASFRAVYDDP